MNLTRSSERPPILLLNGGRPHMNQICAVPGIPQRVTLSETWYYTRDRSCKASLFVEPHILHAPAVEQAVRHDRQSLQLGVPAGREAVVVQDRSSTILLQFPVDVPYETPTLLLIALHRLLIEQLVHLGITIPGVITVGPAGVILIELRVGVVYPGTSEI